MKRPYAVEMLRISKRFGDVVASDDVTFRLQQSEIHALLGENGAGKTTLMRILYGLYHADEGEILVDGRGVVIQSPRDAIAAGIGMVTQHFSLVPPQSVAENVVLGYTDAFGLDMNEARQQVAAACERFGLDVHPAARVADLSVGQRQRVEILRALFRRVSVLILDEPTAVLTPQEVDALFATLQQLREAGLSIIFISHKLNEVMAFTDRVTVLRNGKVIGTVETAETSQPELARMMVGRRIHAVNRQVRSNDFSRSGHDLTTKVAPTNIVSAPALRLENVSAADQRGLPTLKNVSFDICPGEILGLAGVSGNGQVALEQALFGLRAPVGGRVLVDGRDLAGAEPSQFMAAGVGRIPEDRHGGVVAEMTVAQNLVMEQLDDFTRRGVLDHSRIHEYAREMIRAYEIKAAPADPIRTLSGGNMQKVLLARVLSRNPRVIIAAQPTRGLDVGATEYVRARLLEQRERGAAILLISEDLDEILALSDRIAVIYEGQIMSILPAVEADEERLGLLMAGVRDRVAV